MPKILFWNVNKKDLSEKISEICNVHDIEILILAESPMVDDEFLLALNKNRERLFFRDMNISKRIKFYSTYNGKNFQLILDDDYFSIRKIVPYLGSELLLVAVHLPSKLHAEKLDQMFAAQYLSKSIKDIEAARNSKRTLVIGDFNMAPFEDGMVAANGLHAMLDQKLTLKSSRILKGIEYPFFYNPMWGRLGDLTDGPSGTHKYTKAVEINHVWHTYDQVLLRPELLKYFDGSLLKVLPESGSDHYPILLNIKTEVIND